jgi:hypothetical protein
MNAEFTVSLGFRPKAENSVDSDAAPLQRNVGFNALGRHAW